MRAHVFCFVAHVRKPRWLLLKQGIPLFTALSHAYALAHTHIKMFTKCSLSHCQHTVFSLSPQPLCVVCSHCSCHYFLGDHWSAGKDIGRRDARQRKEARPEARKTGEGCSTVLLSSLLCLSSLLSLLLLSLLLCLSFLL